MASEDSAFEQYPFTLASGLGSEGRKEGEAEREAGEGGAIGETRGVSEDSSTSQSQRETEAALDHLLGAGLEHGRFHDDVGAGQDTVAGGPIEQGSSWTDVPSTSSDTLNHSNITALDNPTSTAHQSVPAESIEVDAAEEDNAGAEGDPKPKRKATSRANMLARGGACEFCKRRKLKCSAEEPSCAQCRKMGKECVYSQVKQRSRVRVLEDRLAELEKRLTRPAATVTNERTGTAPTATQAGSAADAQKHGQESIQGQGQTQDQALDTSFYGMLPTPESMAGGSGGHGTLSDPGSSGPSPWGPLANVPMSGMTQPFASYSLSSTIQGHTQGQTPTSIQLDHAASQGREAVFDRSLFPQPDNVSIPALPHSYPGNTPFNHTPTTMLPHSLSSSMPSAMSDQDAPSDLTAQAPRSAEPDLTGMIQAAASPGATATFARIEAGHAPWEGLSAQVLGEMLMFTILGSEGKGGDGGCDASVGESLVSHLLHILLTRPPDALKPFIRSPSRFLSRFSPSSPSLSPHPCLMLAIFCCVLPVSPSPTLLRPGVVNNIISALLPTSSTLASDALSNGDTRVLDVISSQGIRTGVLYHMGRFLDGFKEGAGASGLAWAAGLGKMGGLGEKFGREMRDRREELGRKGSGGVGMGVSMGMGMGMGSGLGMSMGPNGALGNTGTVHGTDTSEAEAERDEARNKVAYMKRVEVERQLRVYRYKGAVVAPPNDAVDWELYCDDKAGALGWGWPCNFDEEEITTPLPVDDYENPDFLLNPEYITDIFHPLPPSTTPTHDKASPMSYINNDKAANIQGHGNECKAWVRALALCYRATRLFDQPSSLRNMTKALELKRAAQAYMDVFPKPELQHSGEWGRLEGPRNEVWMMLHLTMSFIHGRLEVDAKLRPEAPTSEADEHLDRCIRSLYAVSQGIDLARESGDFSFEGYGIMSALSWQAAGRTAYKLAQRMEEEDAASRRGGLETSEMSDMARKARQKRKGDCRDIGDKMVDALRILGKRVPFSGLAAQLVQNVSFGDEVKVGEWVRPDYMA